MPRSRFPGKPNKHFNKVRITLQRSDVEEDGGNCEKDVIPKSTKINWKIKKRQMKNTYQLRNLKTVLKKRKLILMKRRQKWKKIIRERLEIHRKSEGNQSMSKSSIIQESWLNCDSNSKLTPGHLATNLKNISLGEFINNEPTTLIKCVVCESDVNTAETNEFQSHVCSICKKFISLVINLSKKVPVVILPCSKDIKLCTLSPIIGNPKLDDVVSSRCKGCWLKACLQLLKLPIDQKSKLNLMLPSEIQLRIPYVLIKKMNFQTNNILSTNVEKDAIMTNIEVTLDAKTALVGQINDTTSMDAKKDAIMTQTDVTLDANTSSVIKIHDMTSMDAKKNAIVTETDVTLNVETAPVSQNVSRYALSVLDKSVIPNLRRNRSVRSTHSLRTRSNRSIELNKEIEDDIRLKSEKSKERNMISVTCLKDNNLDEIHANGFAVIISKKFNMKPICFLCGSGGQNELIYCANCCEPYHLFCVKNTDFNDQNDRYWKLNWLCERCILCNFCGTVTRNKIQCEKCLMFYHSNCFKQNLKSNIKSICSKCLKCHSCNSANHLEFYDKYLYCPKCLEFRKIGNYCPICFICFENNDCFSQMIECTRCKLRTHINCEKITKDQYYILVYLCDHVNYTCVVCSEKYKLNWKSEVENELRLKFHYVLTCLTTDHESQKLLKLNLKINMKNEKLIPSSNDLINVEVNNNSNNILTNTKINNQEKLTLLMVQKNIDNNKYVSIKRFQSDVESILYNCDNFDNLIKCFREYLVQVFKWHNENYEPENIENVSNGNLENNIGEKKTESILSNIFTDNDIEDKRICSICKVVGDCESSREGRLLYCAYNKWLHANCALWSFKICETINGSLQNAQTAITNSRVVKCFHCSKKGASVYCSSNKCNAKYHFRCALISNCYFMEDKSVYCLKHGSSSDVLTKNILIGNNFNLERPIYVKFYESLNHKKKIIVDEKDVNVVIGSLTIHDLGSYASKYSNFGDVIIPVNFQCTRLYWSTVFPWKLIPYLIKVSLIKSKNDNISTDSSKHFVVDHTLPQDIIQQKLKEIEKFHNSLKQQKTTCTKFNQVSKLSDLCSKYNSTKEMSNKLSMINLDENRENQTIELIQLDGNDDSESSDKEIEIKFQNSILDISQEESCLVKSDKLINYDTNTIIHNNEVIPNDTILNVNDDNDKRSFRTSNKIDDNINDYKLVQLDGNADIECSSLDESDNDDQLFNCKTCQSTYRTKKSYQRHLLQCFVPELGFSSDEYEVSENEPSNNNNNGENYLFQNKKIKLSDVNEENDKLDQASQVLFQNMQQHLIESSPLKFPFDVNSSYMFQPQIAYQGNQMVFQQEPIQFQQQTPQFFTMESSFIPTAPQMIPIPSNYFNSNLIISPNILFQKDINSQTIQFLMQQQYQQEAILQTTQASYANIYSTNIQQVPSLYLIQPSQPLIPTIMQSMPQTNIVQQPIFFCPISTNYNNYDTQILVDPSTKVENVQENSEENHISKKLKTNTPPLSPPPPPPKETPNEAIFNSNVLSPTTIDNNVSFPITNQPEIINNVEHVTFPTTNQPEIINSVEHVTFPITNQPEIINNVDHVIPIEDDENNIDAMISDVIATSTSTLNNSTLHLNEDSESVTNQTIISKGDMITNKVTNICNNLEINIDGDENFLLDYDKENDKNLDNCTQINDNLKSSVKTMINNTNDNLPKLVFEILAIEDTYSNENRLSLKSTSFREIWTTLFDLVQKARIKFGLESFSKGDDQLENYFHVLGLKSKQVRFLLEQLKQSKKHKNYNSKSKNIIDKNINSKTYIKRFEAEFGTVSNSSDSFSDENSDSDTNNKELDGNCFELPSRCRSFKSKKESRDKFSCILWKNRNKSSMIASKNNRLLKDKMVQSIGVFPSSIHGKGVFCLNEFECGVSVIQYTGEVVRSLLADKRERLYNAQGIGCYMFRIDDNFVIDATMKGNAARFINHSCEPNCYSKVVETFGKKQIFIFTLRKISKGEELTYDYKFPLEDDKIPCKCGSKKCRKYLN